VVEPHRCEDTVISRREIRAVMADGARVVDRVGHRVGRIVDVVLDLRTTEPTYMTIACEDPPGAAVVVPLGRVRLRDGSLQVPYAVADVSGAPAADMSGGRMDRRQEEELRRYFAGLDDGDPEQQDPAGGWARQPVQGGDGPPTAEAVAAGRPHTPAGIGVLPLLAGLEVYTGDDRSGVSPDPAPGAPVSTSSPGPPWWERRHWRWHSAPTSVRRMRWELRPLLDMSGLPDDQIEDLVLAAGEAASNAVEHAHLPTLPCFDVVAEVGEQRARIVVQDHGRWRPPTAGGHRGRGLQMIGVLAQATLSVGPQGTTVVLRSRPGPSG
jgi:Histidine kinase-like ATPase domain/PRC-barrel domain